MSSETDFLIASCRESLRQVIDPEVGINIVDLGLVYRLELSDGVLQADITMTSPACPMGEQILAEAEDALTAALPPSVPVQLELVWNPPWSQERMSDFAKLHFGW